MMAGIVSNYSIAAVICKAKFIKIPLPTKWGGGASLKAMFGAALLPQNIA
jgi:hypothetical protein